MGFSLVKAPVESIFRSQLHTDADVFIFPFSLHYLIYVFQSQQSPEFLLKYGSYCLQEILKPKVILINTMWR